MIAQMAERVAADSGVGGSNPTKLLMERASKSQSHTWQKLTAKFLGTINWFPRWPAALKWDPFIR